MSSASSSELERHTAVPVNDPHRALPEHATPGSGGGKGGPLRLIIVLLIIAAVAGGAAWLIHKNSAEMAVTNQRQAAALDRATPVQVAAAQQKTMPIYLTALGSVTAYNTVTIKTRVDGQLIRVNFEEGQTVKKGDLLLQIDPRPYQAAVAQAEGQLIKDQANAANARAEAQRYNALYQANVVSKESADAQASTAGQAEGSIAADQAAIDAAKVNLAYTTITSPIDGVVGLRQVDPGNIVHAADANGLIVITQVHPIAVIFTIPEDQLPQVVQLYHTGRKLITEAWDRSNSTKIATGTLLTLDNEIDQTTGTVKLKAVFANTDNSLFPNQFVNIRLILQDQQDALVIPSAAIQTGSNGTFVYLFHLGPVPESLRQANAPAGGGNGAAGPSGSGGRGQGGGRSGRGGGSGSSGPQGYVTAQPVKVTVTEGSEVIIGSGLNPGDQVVIDGQEKLRNGSAVSISKPPAAQTAPVSSMTGAPSDASSGQNGQKGPGPGGPGSGPNGNGHGRGRFGPGQAGQAGQTAGSADGQAGNPHRQHRNSNGSSNGGGQGPTQ